MVGAARGSSIGPHRNLLLVQQRQPAAGDDAGAEFDRIFREIGQLRQSIAKVFGTPTELAAVPDLAREVALGEQAIRAARHVATDAEMHALIQYLDVDGDLLFSLVARHPSDTALVKAGLNYATSRRTRFAREQAQEVFDWKALVATNQPALWQKLRQAQDRFTDLSVLPSFTGDLKRDQIQQEADAINDLEKNVFASGGLQRAFSMASSSDILADMGVDQLIANVNFGKVLIVYAVYDQIRSPTKNGTLERGPAQYLAIVGHAGAPLKAVALGPAAGIDAMSDAFLTSLKNRPKNDAPFDNGPAAELYRTILAPLRPFFKYSDVDYGSSLLIVPDGALLCIPFAALVDSGKFLIDEFPLALIDSPGDANLIARTNLAPSTRLLAFANPSLAPVVAARLQPLTEADREATQIAALWPANKQQILRQSAATPAALSANAGTAGILHIASHGVFAANLIGLPEPQIMAAPDIKNDTTGLMASSLARSVVLLAPGSVPGATGFVSALAVLGLDLSHTQLVVLAACDTGTGDRERGEGIYGLRRAFLEAGAETVVSSLWSVDSAGTREFMVSFYRNLFQGQGRGDALQHAAAFTRLKYPHPYYWAGFVVTGNLGGLSLPKEN